MLDWKQRIDVMMNFNHSRCIAIDRMDTYVFSILWPTSLDTKLMVTFSNYHLRSRFDTNLVYIKIDTNLVLLGYKKSLKLWWVQFFQTVFEFSPFPFWQTIRMLIFFFQSLRNMHFLSIRTNSQNIMYHDNWKMTSTNVCLIIARRIV